MSVSKHPLWTLLRSSSWFVLANISAGVFHYAFQVCASRELSAAEFAGLNAWFANLALFFLIGGILQYSANFFPTPLRRLYPAIIAINLFCLGLVAAWFYGPPGETTLRALMVLSGSALFGWLMGQIQARLMFAAMSIANLLLGLTKIGLITVPSMGQSSLERYSFALFACYIPALWFISVAVWRHRAPARHQGPTRFSWGLWGAPLILSAASSIIPQMDLVLMDRIQSAIQYQEFARTSLFYKGIYFLLFILAQWLLPQQIRKVQGQPAVRWWLFAAAALLSSAGLALASPLISAWILRWSEAPGMELVFLSCLNMSLLAWIFFLIQAHCASHQVRLAGLGLILLGAEAGLQILLHLQPHFYLFLAILTQASLVFILSRRPLLVP
jgi:hypothetical protein